MSLYLNQTALKLSDDVKLQVDPPSASQATVILSLSFQISSISPLTTDYIHLHFLFNLP